VIAYTFSDVILVHAGILLQVENPSFPRKNVTPADSKSGRESRIFGSRDDGDAGLDVE
jgi:hypothetical protein